MGVKSGFQEATLLADFTPGDMLLLGSINDFKKSA
jgi:hypothetical protein